MSGSPEHIPDVGFKEAIEEHDKTSNFEIISLKELKSRVSPDDHDPRKPHRIHFYAIFYPYGKGQHLIDFKTFDFEAGDILLVAKNQIHAFLEHSSECIIILFREKFLTEIASSSQILSRSKLYNYHMYTPLIKGEKIENEHIHSLIDLILQESRSSFSPHREEIVGNLIKNVLIKCEIAQEERQQLFNPTYYETFVKFKNRLEKEYMNCRNAKVYASELGITYKHINTICKAMVNKTAKEFIDDFVILEIKRRLIYKKLSIKELSFHMGFDEPSNFTKFFKKHTSLTPKQFLLNNLKG